MTVINTLAAAGTEGFYSLQAVICPKVFNNEIMFKMFFSTAFQTARTRLLKDKPSQTNKQKTRPKMCYESKFIVVDVQKQFCATTFQLLSNVFNVN